MQPLYLQPRSRSRAAVARRAHNPKVGSSILPFATVKTVSLYCVTVFLCYFLPIFIFPFHFFKRLIFPFYLSISFSNLFAENKFINLRKFCKDYLFCAENKFYIHRKMREECIISTSIKIGLNLRGEQIKFLKYCHRLGTTREE